MEVHDVVAVATTSPEDIFAVKVLNLCKAVTAILNGSVLQREIPIFGAPFHGIFLMGMIDEIRCDQDTFALDLVEFKTRNYNSLPSKAQKFNHDLQVIIYKKLFDDLVSGKTSKQLISNQFQLDLFKPLGADISAHIQLADLKNCCTLDALLNVLYERMSAVPKIGRMLVEYCYQADRSTIAICEVTTALCDVQSRLDHYVAFWHGNREVGYCDVMFL